MSCKQVRRMLSYRREWTREESAHAEAHLAACPTCQAVARQYELMDRRFDRLPVPVTAAVGPPLVRAAAGSAPRTLAPRPAVPAPRASSRAVLALVAIALLIVAAAVLSVSPPRLARQHEPAAVDLGTIESADNDAAGAGPGAAWTRVPAALVPFPSMQAGADARITVLLLGIDRRGGSGWGYRTDTILLVTADPRAGTAAMLSIPRDLQVPIPGLGDNRINVANVYGYVYDYPGGGSALTIDTIEANFGIEIDAYVVVDFDGFVGIVDALGGIDVDVPSVLDDPHYPDPRPGDPYAYTTLHFDAGVQHMDGARSLQYARSRMTTSDADRAERQQRILLAILHKLHDASVFRRLPGLVARLADTVHTDLALSELLDLATLAAQFNPSTVRRQVLREPLVTAHTRDDGAAVLLPDWDLIDPVVADLLGPVAAFGPVSHMVVSGDNVWSIARRYRLEPETIVWANPDIEPDPDLLVVGQTLIIPPVDGVWHTVVEGDTVQSLAKEFGTMVEKIVAFEGNVIEDPSSLRVGQQIMIPDGRIEIAPANRSPMTASITPPKGALAGSGRYVWPAAGQLSQPFWSGHGGIDVAGYKDVPIRAADTGYVTLAGRDTYGYGLQIVVDHGNGYLTRYAHLDTVLVEAGDSVQKGQQIGTMGASGRATSVHLHFEIVENGIPRNPVGFLP